MGKQTFGFDVFQTGEKEQKKKLMKKNIFIIKAKFEWKNA
jgi:hypothetical protein